MKNKQLKNYRFILFSIGFLMSLFFTKAGFSEQVYWTPKEPPKSHPKIEVQIDVQNNIVKGEETVTFINPASKNISVVGFNWTMAEHSTIAVKQNRKLLALINPQNNPPVPAPLFYVLDESVKPKEKLTLTVTFSVEDLLGFNPVEIKLINWFPRLWWDDLSTQDSFEVRLDLPPEYTFAVSGILNEKTGYYENQGVRTFGIYLRKDLKGEIYQSAF